MSDNRAGTDAERSVLAERAKALAFVAPHGADPGESTSALGFSLGGELYAIEDRYVVEVSAMPALTPLPCAPPFVRGILNVRGRVIALLDLRVILGLSNGAGLESPNVLIVGCPTAEFALAADEIRGIVALGRPSVQEVPEDGAGRRVGRVLGFTADGLTLLDAARMLEDTALVADERVGGPP